MRGTPTPTPDDPWAVSADDYPWRGSPAERLTFLLNYAVLAPSGHNMQPWLFVVNGDEVELYADRTRALPAIDPEHRELVMSCGAALFHLRTAIRYFGHRPVVRTFPDLTDGDLLAYVRLGAPRLDGEADQTLFQAIKSRRTNRLAFEPHQVPDAEIEALRDAARQEGATLHVVHAPAERQVLAGLIAEGDEIQGADRAFRRELSTLLHPNHTTARDGIPGYARGKGDLASLAGPLVTRTFDWGKREAEKDRLLVSGSPLLLVLSTPADNPTGWMDAGQALARVLLRACHAGLYASFLNQPVQVPELRTRLRMLVDGKEHPHAVLRMGHGWETRPTPRRPLHEVVVRSRYAL